MAKEYFTAKGFSYEEHNVAEDSSRLDEMVQKSGQMGVPVIDIDGKIFVGFNKPEIEKALTS